jgi:hypothetical protein
MDRKPRNVRKNEQSAGGGHKQREQAEIASGSSDKMHSELARFLLVSFLTGKTSLPFIVAIAALVLEEPAGGHADIKHIASLGGNGAAPGDMRKSLWRKMQVFVLESAIATIRLPVKIRGQLDWIDFDMLYPHAIFAKLHASDRIEFGRRFYGGVRDRIRTYWQGQVDHPSFAGHPMHDNEYDHEQYACPLFFHCDDVGSIGIGKVWAKAINVLSFGGILSGGRKADDSHILIWMLFNHILNRGTSDQDTNKVLWRHFTWSLYWLLKGIWPLFSPDGVPCEGGGLLADGFFGVMWFMQFDHACAKDCLKQFGECMSCDATTVGPQVWTDCREPDVNGWVHTTYTNATHALKFGDFRVRILRALPGFGIANYVPDLLHCKWLGADQYFLGGVLWLLAAYIMPNTVVVNLKNIVKSIKEAYKDEHVDISDRYPDLKKTQIKKMTPVTTLPKLKGTGQQCKGLTRVMETVFREFADLSDPRHIRILNCLKLMKEVNQLYLTNLRADRIPPQQSARIISASFEIAQITAGLVRYYHGQGVIAFHYTKKLHDCLHAAMASKYCNPMNGDCSAGEDFMKVAKQSIRGSMFGNRIAKSPNVALRKYVKAWHLKRGKQLAWWRR